MILSRWSKTAASNNAAVPDGAPDGWTGANVNEVVRECMAQIRTTYEDSAYIEITYQLTSVGAKTLARVSATQINVLACDATTYFTANRRIKIVGATTGYGVVDSSALNGSDTEVTVTMEAADVPTSPTAIYVHVDSTIRNAAFKAMGDGEGLDADTVDGLEGGDLSGNAFKNHWINGAPLVWQRYTGSAVSCPVSTRTYVADRIFANPAGAAVTVNRTTTRPTDAIVPYAMLVTGATSVGVVTIAGQRFESLSIPPIKRMVTFSALIKNSTSASLTVSLLVGTPGAADDFTTVTNRLTATAGTILSGGSSRLTYSVDISGYTNIDNGIQVEWRVPSGALDSASKTITICEMQVEAATVHTGFGVSPLSLEEARCYRYYWLSGPKTATQANGCPIAFVSNDEAAVEYAWGSVMWPSKMRATPTVATWHNNLTGRVYDFQGAATISGCAAHGYTDTGLRSITLGSSVADGGIVIFNVEADAEL